MGQIPAVVQDAIDDFAAIPGIGQRTAARIVFWLVRRSDVWTRSFSEHIRAIGEDIRLCSVCNNITDKDPCDICSDPERANGTICVVEEPSDMLAIERSGAFKGRYHILGGVIDLVNDVRPENLAIESLLKRIPTESVGEIIIATNPTQEGNITATYIKQLLKEMGVKISRIAQGLSYGSDLEFANQRSIQEAFANRREE